MGNGIYLICGAVILLLYILYCVDRYVKTQRAEEAAKAQKPQEEPQQQQPEPPASDFQCCGKHLVCEKQKLAEARMREAQYFDDEDLDRFKGRASDSYDDAEVEEFRYVMYTMRQEEVRQWLECLQAREVEIPDELKEEAWSMLNEDI